MAETMRPIITNPRTWLKLYRKRYNVTQADVASICGVKVSTVKNWEAGRARVTGEAVLKLQKIAEKYST